ncbi:MAG TPA: lanthionine synthetase LanC family protein [Gaiellaceae bacterium]|nr:lanthionine synthetase LanC family protein [Gaiellaceae bacterium]
MPRRAGPRHQPRRVAARRGDGRAAVGRRRARLASRPAEEGRAGLCHGTAGNGCAFLALHARTGDDLWLERARAFAMHALGQVERAEPRYSLWTGDVGVALYLRACLEGWQGMPIVDVL